MAVTAGGRPGQRHLRGGKIAILGVLVIAVILPFFSPAVRLAPASLYLLLANLPGVPAGPISAALGQPVMVEWGFQGKEGRVEADVYHPPGGGVHPTLLIVNGLVRRGRKYPALASFGRALARAGYTAVLPDYPDLLEEALTPASLSDLEYTVRHIGDIPSADPKQVELVGFCVGATLSLLAVEDPKMPPVRAVVALSGYYSVQDMIQLITTNTFWRDGRLYHYATDPWVVAVVARSLVRALPDARDRAVFAPFVVDPPPDHYVPPDWSKVPANRLSPSGQALLALLRNTRPAHVSALLRALPASFLQRMQSLSPKRGIARLRTPVYIVADHHDPYIPDVESRDLHAAQPKWVHLAYVSILEHVEPELQVHSSIFKTIWDTVSGAWQLFLAIDQSLVAVQS